MMKSLFTILFIGLMGMVSGQNVGINDDGSSPASGAILDVKSSSKGLLIPRTTIASITSPSEGMLIYDTSKKRFMLHTGSNWYELMTEEDSGPFERDGTTLKQKGNYTDDLLFGTSSINSATISPYDRLIYFDQFRGAFRGGQFEDPSYLNSLGLFSFAYGGNTKADGGFSFAIGSTTTASGSYSFAGGRNTSADGYASFSMGNNVSAPSAYETQLGVYGKSYTPSSSTSWVGTDRLFSIGNGTFTGVNSSNALTILKNGKLGIGEVDPGARLHVNADVGEHLLKLEEDNSDKLTFRLNPQGDLIYDTETTNTLIGNDAGEMMSSGTMNVMLGKSAGRDVSGYSDNVFIGGESGLGASGEMNTFLGRGAGSGSTGSRNVFLGHSVGYFKSGSDQLHIHNSSSSTPLVYGEFNNAILKINGGLRASDGFEDDDGDTKIQVEENNDDDVIRFDISGSEELILKKNNSNLLVDFPQVTSSSNLFIGNHAGASTQTPVINMARDNVFIGHDTGLSNTTGPYNTFLGNSAGKNNVSGNENSYIGHKAGEYNVDGENNFFGGALAGTDMTSGNDNTFLGLGAGRDKTDGDNNVLIGSKAGEFSGTSSNNIFIGRQAGRNETSSNRLYIDNSSTSQPLIYGDFSDNELEINGDLSIDVHTGAGETIGELRFKDAGTTEYSFRHHTTDNYFYLREDRTSTTIAYAEDGNFGIRRRPTTNDLEVNGTASKSSAGDWLANSDARLKKNIKSLSSDEILDKVTSIQGITYEWNDNRENQERPEGIQFGFTAQDIQKVFPTLVSEDAEGYLQTSYGTFDAMYVESIKALLSKVEQLEKEKTSQAEEIENLNAELNKTNILLSRINQRLAALEINN